MYYETEMIQQIAARFAVVGTPQGIKPYGTGHINDTFLLAYAGQRAVLQRINRMVFSDPVGVMANFEEVVGHIGRKTAHLPDAERRVLRLIPTDAGRAYVTDDNGDVWRMTRFIEQTVTHDIVRSLPQLREAGRAFGQFQQQLSDLSADRLVDTIPNFHNARLRFDALLTAIGADACRRSRAVQHEIDFALAQEPLVDHLLRLNADGTIPTRVTHNDSKINNLLFDQQTGAALCVTDLDTTMAGLALYDFGDLVRSAVTLAAEDEQDLENVQVDLERFRQLAHGYLEAADEMLNGAERANLVHAAQLLTFVIGVRFLTDHLNGDRYFKIHRPNHNLDRARVQFKLVASMQDQAGRMEAIVAG